jgi:hypothetical protein
VQRWAARQRHAVADGRRQCDHRAGNQAANDADERRAHARRDDDNGRRSGYPRFVRAGARGRRRYSRRRWRSSWPGPPTYRLVVRMRGRWPSPANGIANIRMSACGEIGQEWRCVKGDRIRAGRRGARTLRSIETREQQPTCLRLHIVHYRRNLINSLTFAKQRLIQADSHSALKIDFELRRHARKCTKALPLR